MKCSSAQGHGGRLSFKLPQNRACRVVRVRFKGAGGGGGGDTAATAALQRKQQVHDTEAVEQA